VLTFEGAVGAGRATTGEALELFDSLEPVSVEFMLGTWRGAEFPTDHWMDGLLTATGWYGKHFADSETVHPLLFHTSDRRAAFPVDPALLPMNLRLPTGGGRSYHRLITGARPLLKTSRPTARLRMTEYRGVSTATMIYDAKPINDLFRKVSADTVLGLMDYRRFTHPYFFVLHRDPDKPLRL
jgi:GXWXG protein/uncharacterized protein DUF4334